MADFNIGDEFNTFEDFEARLKEFEAESFVKLWRRDSRTLAAAQTRIKRLKDANVDIKYAEATYCCVHGGRDFKARTKTGERPNTSTFRQACGFKIRIKASPNGQKLVVADVVKTHNHEVTKSFFELLPSQRKLDKETKKKAKEMLDVKANKKMVQQYLTEKTGKVVLLKDVHNLQAREDRQKIKPQEELQQLCSWLDEREDLYVQYVTDENQQIQGIYMQDKTMYKIFDAFPEVILVDATHKTNDVRMPLYLILVVDGNGESQIVASFLVHNEEEHLIREMIRIFKEQNQKWEKVNVALTDKDMERKVLKSEMPQISLSLCLFHVLRTFKREITMEKMGLTNEERNAALEILQRLTYILLSIFHIHTHLFSAPATLNILTHR